MCENWPKDEYSHHTQSRSLSGGLKLRNLLLDTRICTIKANKKVALSLLAALGVLGRKEYEKISRAFSMHFAKISRPNLVFTPVKST